MMLCECKLLSPEDWVIADTHFFHNNINKYEPCRLELGDDPDAEMMRRWNETVGEDDRIVHLGDLAFGTREQVVSLRSLNGEKHLLMGNHDMRSKTVYKEAGFTPLGRVNKGIRAVGQAFERWKNA